MRATRAEVRCLRNSLIGLTTNQFAVMIRSHLTIVGNAFLGSLKRVADALKELILDMNETNYIMIFSNIHQPVFAANRHHVKHLSSELIVKLIWVQAKRYRWFLDSFENGEIDDYHMDKCILVWMYVAKLLQNQMNSDMENTLNKLIVVLFDSDQDDINIPLVHGLVNNMIGQAIDCRKSGGWKVRGQQFELKVHSGTFTPDFEKS
jgi:hypothetical protein